MYHYMKDKPNWFYYRYRLIRFWINWHLPKQTYCFWCDHHINGRWRIVWDNFDHIVLRRRRPHA